MTGDESAPGHDTGLCGAQRRGANSTCRRPAGWGTSHPGTGRCKLHGGATATHVTHAARLDAERVLRQLGHTDPIGDPVTVLRQLAAALRQSLDALADRIGDELTITDAEGRVRVSPLYGLWRDLADRLHAALVALARLGTPDTVVTVNVGVPVSEVLARVADAVRPYPDAAAAVALLLLELAEHAGGEDGEAR